MIIFTNEGNPYGLHLFICARLARKDVSVQFCNVNGE